MVVPHGYNRNAFQVPEGQRVKTIRNQTNRPIKIPLAGGKVLYLGPRKTGQVADSTGDSPRVRKMIDAGEIEIAGEGSGRSGGADAGGDASRPSTHGHRPPTSTGFKGER